MRHLDDGALQAWLDRDRSGIDAGEAREIERHLARCDVCAARLAELEELTERSREVLASAGPVDADIPDFRFVVERSRRAGSGRRSARPWMAAGWAASLVAALGVGWLANDLVRGEQGMEPAPAAEAESRVAMADAEGPGAEAGRAGGPAAAPSPEPEPERGENAPPAPARAEEAAPVSEPAGSAVVVRGRVTDERDEPVAAVMVSAEGAGVGELTREDGTFSLTLPASLVGQAAREVTLTARQVGFRVASREVAIGGADTVTADLRLAPAALALDEIVVTGAGRVEDITIAPTTFESSVTDEGGARRQADHPPACYDLEVADWSQDPHEVPPATMVLHDTTHVTDVPRFERGRKVARPVIHRGPMASAFWHRIAADSIEVVWTDGFTGIRMRLGAGAEGEELTGAATTFTDAFIVGEPRSTPTAAVRAIRVECR